MEFRRLGNSDLDVSVVGLGGNTFGQPRLDRAASIDCIRKASERGVNIIDTALIYGAGESETYIGEAICGHRKDWIVATKFNFFAMGEGETVGERISKQCEESLRKLGTDYIDLYQIHMPAAGIREEEILEAQAGLVSSGKVRWIGECNYASWRHAEANGIAEAHGWPQMVSAQNHYSLLHRQVEIETLPFCRERNVGFLPYHPLAGGFLADKYVKGEAAPEGTRGAAGSPIVTNSRTPQNEDMQDALKTWARERGHTLAELAFAWLLARPEVTSIVAGVSSPAQVEMNVRGGSWVLSQQEKEEIDKIASPSGR